LPDGKFANQKSQLGYILEGLGMENVGIPMYYLAIRDILRPFGICTYYYGPSAKFTVLWYILLPFGVFSVILLYFFPFLYVVPIKIWQP
jgi:hypothetical protein